MVKDDCIFCKIANGEIPSTTLYEDEKFRVILDLGPASKGHSLVIPKEHFEDLFDLSKEYSSEVLSVAQKVGNAFKQGLSAEGFNIVQNNGEIAGQTVKHFHLHIIPRYTGGPELPLWNPGKLTPEIAEEIAKKVTISLDK